MLILSPVDQWAKAVARMNGVHLCIYKEPKSAQEGPHCFEHLPLGQLCRLSRNADKMAPYLRNICMSAYPESLTNPIEIK